MMSMQPCGAADPLVSIIINNFNYGRFLSECIKSALDQTYHSVEVVVVDDGSTDNSRNVIHDFAGKVIPVLKANGGQASAFNAGFASSRGDVVCFLDSDDFFAPHKVKRIVELFGVYPTAGWVFHELQYVDKGGALLSQKDSEWVQEGTLIDARSSIMKGRRVKGLLAPGLCVRRNVLFEICPIPEQLRVTADQFLNQAAVYLSPGIRTSERLAFQRVHETNVWTFRQGADQFKAEHKLITAYYLRKSFPGASRYTNRLFSYGLAVLLATGGLGMTRECKELRDYLTMYFSFNDWIRLSPRIAYDLVRARQRLIRKRDLWE